jgi:formylglycine-generating enzyme required for sulfatase activity
LIDEMRELDAKAGHPSMAVGGGPMARKETWNDGGISRRDFLRGATRGAFAGSLLLGGMAGVAEGMDPSWNEKEPTGELPREVANASGITMIQVPKGSFIMGDGLGEVDEKPHRVHVASFYVDKYPVTQREYERVTGENPARWRGAENPVEQIRWSDAVRYCNARSALENLRPCYHLKTWECDFGATGYRLPTEAEWEYACRAGAKTRYVFGDQPEKLKHYAWTVENSGGRPRPVGRKLPNPWGLCDVYGNVWEWCNDYYKVDYYEESPEANPKGPDTGENKVLRGGCWRSTADECRSSFRYNETPGYTDICFGYDIYGFRCVKNGPA